MSTTRVPGEPEWKPRSELSLLNTDIPRVDGPEKVTGRARYTHDVRLPGMVWVRVLLSPFPRATVHGIDVEPARAVPGVVYAEARKEEGSEVRFHGGDGVLAVVAGETPEAAHDGLRAIVHELEEQWPPVVSHEGALDPDSADVLPNAPGNVSREGVSGYREDVETELEFCDAVVDATYTLPIQHHVCLETHGTVVDFDGGDEATVYSSIQAVSGANGEAARYLGLAADKVRVITHHMGGGFGSKFSLGLEGRIACEVARALERPAHLMLKRPDEFIMAGNRSGSIQHMRAGATLGGELVALINEADRLGGMGAGSLPVGDRPYIYNVANYASKVRSVHTATDANRAMRAPGHPQASFAMESIIDELAYAIEMDPVEFRKVNLEDEVWHRQLDRVAREIGWYEHPNRTRPGKPDGGWVEGIGFGVAVWGSGSRPGSRCEVKVFPDGSVTSTTGTQDLGTGARTYVAAIVAEEFGLPIEAVTARIGESSFPPSAASGGSVTTGCSAPAIKDGAHKARESFEGRLARHLGTGGPGEFLWREGRVWPVGEEDKALTWKQACAVLGTDPVVELGEWQPSLRGTGVHGAQAARVRVDTLTGELKVVKMVFIQDCGLVLNRMSARSQINGGQIQALSYGLFEERIYDAELGMLLTANMEDYKIAGSADMPEIVSLLDDEDERLEVMGMAEANCIPGHGAIANALYNACGVRIRDLPLSPTKIVTALHSS